MEPCWLTEFRCVSVHVCICVTKVLCNADVARELAGDDARWRLNLGHRHIFCSLSKTESRIRFSHKPFIPSSSPSYLTFTSIFCTGFLFFMEEFLSVDPI